MGILSCVCFRVYFQGVSELMCDFIYHYVDVCILGCWDVECCGDVGMWNVAVRWDVGMWNVAWMLGRWDVGMLRGCWDLGMCGDMCGVEAWIVVFLWLSIGCKSVCLGVF